MPETAEEVYARVVAAVGEDGRLPLPEHAAWDTFPFDGDIRTRILQPPLEAEEPRNGENDQPCWRCEHELENVIWRNEDWLVASTPRPTGLPVVLALESRAHMDFLDMDDVLASEFGRITNNLHRILHYLPNVGRVHISKWGDGGAHLHTWFMARPARMPQLRGTFASLWDDILPPVPEDIWRSDLHEVARKLATHDGVALV
ncbi:MAG TPA: hypothetical protein VFR87_13765 [Nocardioidaceae bacterium]|nr:hypothetical protein [Nocardioidaceae bacterium]